jgi:hypothetical protein
MKINKIFSIQKKPKTYATVSKTLANMIYLVSMRLKFSACSYGCPNRHVLASRHSPWLFMKWWQMKPYDEPANRVCGDCEPRCRVALRSFGDGDRFRARRVSRGERECERLRSLSRRDQPFRESAKRELRRKIK